MRLKLLAVLTAMLLGANVALADGAASTSLRATTANEPKTDFRLSAGLSLIGTWSGGYRSSPGEKVTEGAGSAEVGALVGGSLGLFRYLGVTAHGRFQNWPSGWQSHRGETRRILELALGPELRLPFRNERWSGAFALAPTFGGTFAWITPGPARAVNEEYSGGRGYNLGAMLGFHFVGLRSRFGGFTNVGLTRHSVTFDYTASLVESPTMRIEERRQFEQIFILWTAGAVWLF